MRISSDCLPILSRAFARHSCECRTSILKIFMCRKLVAKFLNRFKKIMQMFSSKYFARLSRVCRNNENENENKTHSRESRETLSRMSRDCRATVARQSRGIFSKLDQNSRICRINVHSMRMQRKSCVCLIVNLCSEIVENYSRTSLQLSHTSEVGVLS